jgi:hypothetical protein
MVAIDWTDIQKKYAGQWVAFKDDEETVVGNGTTAKEALDKAQANGYEEPILAVMPKEVVTYIGGYEISV